jgi:lipoyl(octanoyl) transferase
MPNYIFNVDNKNNVLVRYLGICDYTEIYTRMREFTDLRAQTHISYPDEIWCVQHPAVYTLGQAGLSEHLLSNPLHIPCVQTNRGGQITYHGIGQLVVYILMDLRKNNIYVRELVYRIEQTIIDALSEYHIHGLRKEGAPGIYVENNTCLNKIAAIGLKVSRGFTYHGFALNVDMDLTPFSYINPCGYAGLNTIDMHTILKNQPPQVNIDIDININDVCKHVLNYLLQ